MTEIRFVHPSRAEVRIGAGLPYRAPYACARTYRSHTETALSSALPLYLGPSARLTALAPRSARACLAPARTRAHEAGA